MENSVDIPVISIGNSKGIRLSKAVLERYGIHEKIELIFEKGYIILKPKQEARKGWDKAFSKMHLQGEDQLLIPDVFDDEIIDE